MTEQKQYSPTVLLACLAGRLLEDGKSVFVGTGLPMVAAMLAQRIHAPKLLIIFEAGGIGPQIPVLPMSVGDSRTFYQASGASSMHDVMSLSQAGYLDFGFLGAAQIDRYGNINTTVIGDYAAPDVRLPGSGGANDVGSSCQRTIIIMRQDLQKFVEKVDFVTTPGYLSGVGAREKAGLPAGSGPYRVITQMGVYGFNEQTKEMELLSIHPGITTEHLIANSGIKFDIPEPLLRSEPPTEEEMHVLNEIDPDGLVIKR